MRRNNFRSPYKINSLRQVMLWDKHGELNKPIRIDNILHHNIESYLSHHLHHGFDAIRNIQENIFSIKQSIDNDKLKIQHKVNINDVFTIRTYIKIVEMKQPPAVGNKIYFNDSVKLVVNSLEYFAEDDVYIACYEVDFSDYSDNEIGPILQSNGFSFQLPLGTNNDK